MAGGGWRGRTGSLIVEAVSRIVGLVTSEQGFGDLAIELVVDNASTKVARHAGIEPARLVGHEINPELLHKAAAFYHLMCSGADSSASRKGYEKLQRY